MRLRFSMAGSMLVLGLVQGFVSLSAHAQQAFPTNAAAYSSTEFKTSSQVKRKLYYRSEKGNEYHFSDNNGQLKLTAVSKNSDNIFADVSPTNKNYAQEKQLLASYSLEQITDLQADLKELEEDISSVQAKIKATESPEEKSKITLDKLSPLNQQKSALVSRINSLQSQVNSIKALPVISLFELFQKQPSGDVVILHEQSLYLLTSVVRRVNASAAIAQSSSQARAYTYVNRAYVKLGAKSASQGKNKPFFTVERIANTNSAFSYDGEQFTLTRIEDNKILELLSMIKSNPVEPASFEFKGDVLTTQYQWQKSKAESKSLLVEYKYSGKKKNLVQVKTEAETEVYDPKTPSATIVKHIGILAPTKSGALLELKKVQKTNNKTDGGWALDYKERVIKLGSEFIFLDQENYYGFEGLWYLSYWLKNNNVQTQKLYLINGLQPVFLTAQLQANRVEYSYGGKVMYRFTFDKANFITKFEFVPEGQELILTSKDTKATKKNRDKLTSYMKQNGIVKL